MFARQTPDQVAIAPAGSSCPGDARRRAAELADGLPLPRPDEIRLRGAAQPRERDGRDRRGARGAGVPARRDRRGAAHVRRRAAPPRGGGDASTACSTSTTRRRPTSPSAARAASRPSRAACTLILGGSLKGGGFEELREPVAERCRACYLIGEAAERLAADLAEARVPLRRCGDLETAVAAAARGRRAGRGGAALTGLRELRPVPRLRGARRALPRPDARRE